MIITFEKNGVKMSVGSEIQASAFALSGWKRMVQKATDSETKRSGTADEKQRAGRPPKK